MSKKLMGAQMGAFLCITINKWLVFNVLHRNLSPAFALTL